MTSIMFFGRILSNAWQVLDEFAPLCFTRLAKGLNKNSKPTASATVTEVGLALVARPSQVLACVMPYEPNALWSLT